jgi:hypothetical protein
MNKSQKEFKAELKDKLVSKISEIKEILISEG